MYIAMNRFQIVLGKEGDFEKIWRDRETHLDKVPGKHSSVYLGHPVFEGFEVVI